MSTRWRTLGLATAGLNVVFLVWFSFAPFTGALREEFGLSLAAVGVLASAAVWGAPVGQAITGWCSDRFGATTVFPAILGVVGVASVASAFASRPRPSRGPRKPIHRRRTDRSYSNFR